MSSNAGVDRRIERSRTAITSAAAKVFSARGYLGTGLDEVAERAGVSKKTIYNVIGDKERLFRQVVEHSIGIAERYASRAARALMEVPEVEPSMRQLVVELARTVLTGQVVPIRRLLIGEVHRFPELAEEYYRRGPQTVMDTLARALRRLDARGQLDVPDAEAAAEHLAFLVLGPTMDRALFRIADRPPDRAAQVEARAHVAFDAFLAIYRPGGAAHGGTAARSRHPSDS